MNAALSSPKAQRRRPEVQTVRQTFLVPLQHGLHARPCALLVKTLRPFQSSVQVKANGEEASGHSIMSLMALAASHGSKISFTISGDDAHAAMAAVRRLFDTHFEDAYQTPAAPAKAPTAYASDD
jgi:multiphosphoryl transfer protein